MGTPQRWWLLIAVPTALAGVACGWSLARPEDPTPSSAVRTLCLLLGSGVLGLAALGRWDSAGSRSLAQDPRLWRLASALAGSWMLAETVLLAMTTAEADARGLPEVSVSRFGAYLTGISAGRVECAVIACTAAATIWSVVAFRRSNARQPVPILVLAAFAIVARPISGHMSQQALGPALDAVHALAAAAWLGLLAALALTLRSRSDWSTWLPRYSTVAWRCVCVLTATGVLDAVVRLGGPAAFLGTGYGRIVLAKALALAVLLGLGWWWRHIWVDQAAAHRVTAEDSLRRAVIEVVAMAVPFGLAAALATTSSSVIG